MSIFYEIEFAKYILPYRHRPNLAHHRRRTETQRRVLVISLAL